VKKNPPILKIAIKKTWNNFKGTVPLIITVILLVSLLVVNIPDDLYEKVLGGKGIINSILGAIIGAITAGNPVNSYIIGGDLLKHGVDIITVVSFMLAWVTVGLVQLPAESIMLGKRFAITRNIVAFISAIIIAHLTYFTLNIYEKIAS